MLTQFLYGFASRGIREDFFHQEGKRARETGEGLYGEMLTQFLYGFVSRGIREDFFHQEGKRARETG
ncbi:MAG: hypothetical protein P1U86_14475, partial [Verrucomicrobiales bacterium]|nr:hypothetical protein [Verrucomicrobiales bacterium]